MAAVARREAAEPQARVVMVQRTELAPNCMGLSIKARHVTLWNRTPAEAVAEILTLLDRPAHALSTHTTQLGDVALLGAVNGNRWPLAFVWDGLDEAEISAELRALAGEGRR